MATFNFKELFSNQFRKDGTLKARNTIENYMRCLHNRYTNIYEFEEKTYFGHTKSFYNHRPRVSLSPSRDPPRGCPRCARALRDATSDQTCLDAGNESTSMEK